MDLKLRVAKLIMYTGILGFAACWVAGWTTESRVFGSPIFLESSINRTEPTWVKGKRYFLEPANAQVFKVSQWVISYTFLLAILGGAYVDRRKRKG